MITNIINPFGVTIKDVVIKKFGGGEPMSIKPQVIEFVLYQSIFSPTLKGNLAIYDAVNLLNNYPLVGEETVEVTIEQQGARFSTEKMTVTLEFVIAGITNVEFGSTGRDQTYFIEIHSVEAFQNAKKKVSKAYKSADTEAYLNDILSTYLRTKKKLRTYVPSIQDAVERVFVVPNLRPFAAVNWLSKMTIPSSPDEYHNYLFFETIYDNGSRFVFKPFQKHVWRDSEDDNAALKGSENHPFFYISNYETVSNSPSAAEKLSREGFVEERLILNLKINKRYSVLEKIIGGYFENEYVEINMDQKTHEITKTTVNDPWKQLYYKKYLQTEAYINDVIQDNEDKESSGRVKYVTFNYAKLQDPQFRNRWGKQEISKLATSQVDLTVDVHTNLQLVPGDLIYVNVPEMHGFENVNNDRYLNGHFYVTENKMVIRSTGETTMSLRINKDSYFSPIELKMRYNLEGGK